MKNHNRVPAVKLNNQAAMGYTLYMMMTSFFKKVTSLSPILEEQIYLCYRSQSKAAIEVMENICVAAVDHYLPDALPKYIQDCRVQARLRKNKTDGVITLIFDGGIFTLEVSAKINGTRRALIKYTFREEG